MAKRKPAVTIAISAEEPKPEGRKPEAEEMGEEDKRRLLEMYEQECGSGEA
jgi:hypothetical protein